MPAGTFTGDIAVRGRRFAHLATVRLILSLAYLILELALAPEDLVSFKTLFAVAFVVYAALIVVYGSRVRIRSSALSIQFGDLLFTVILVLLARPGDAALPLLLFYFVLAESSLLHSGREVLLVTAVILVFYTGWMTSGEAQVFQFSYGSFMFLLVVAGVLAYYFSDQAHRVEGNIGTGLRRAVGAGFGSGRGRSLGGAQNLAKVLPRHAGLLGRHVGVPRRLSDTRRARRFRRAANAV